MTGRPLTSSSSRITYLLAFLGIAAFVACGSSDRPTPNNPDDDSTDTGGSKGTSGSKTSKGGSGGSSGSSVSSTKDETGGSSNKGGSSTGSAGSAGSKTSNSGGAAGKSTSSSSAGAAGKSSSGSAGSSKGGSAGTSESGSAGSSSSGTAGGAGQGAAGTTEIVCSNTDKTILPVDEAGWVDKTCNTCGIQGAFYWYADDNTKKNLKCGGAECKDGTPPWSASSKGMCVSGKATGSSDDWGAGIGLSLNDSGGDSSVKGSFDATKAPCGKITGFDLTLSGDTNGMPVRVGFATSKDGKTISPFIEVPDPGGKDEKLSGSSQIVITNAKIPTDWKSTDPSPPDPAELYDLQIQVAADTADANDAFEICVKDVKPVYAGSTGGGGSGGGSTCKTTQAAQLGTDTNVQDGGGFGFQSNANSVASGNLSTTGYTGSGCAGLSVTTSGIKSNGDQPAAYPSIINGWQWGKNYHGSYSSAKALSSIKTVKSSMTFTPPSGNKWDVAYDIWLANSGSISAPDNTTLEVMVWLDYSGQVTTNPIGSKTDKTLDVGGSTWEIWSGTSNQWKVVSFRRGQSTAPVTDLDLLQFIKEGLSVSGASSSNLLGVQAGFELFDVSGGGSIDYYTLTIN